MNPTTARSLVTRDLGQIVALILSGVKPITVHRESGVAVIEFADDDRTNDVLKAYLLDDLQFSLRSIMNMERNIKAYAINGSRTVVPRF